MRSAHSELLGGMLSMRLLLGLAMVNVTEDESGEGGAHDLVHG